nr:MAG TPA: hypothetical protein [Caudoviricetes sp.]
MLYSSLFYYIVCLTSEGVEEPFSSHSSLQKYEEFFTPPNLWTKKTPQGLITSNLGAYHNRIQNII